LGFRIADLTSPLFRIEKVAFPGLIRSMLSQDHERKKAGYHNR
jgi:hypothetical protein